MTDKQLKLTSTITGGITNAAMAGVKLYIGLFANSVSVISDSINNFSDMFGFAGATVGIGLRDKKPTEKFPFGFGRIEYIVSFLISVLILVVGGVFFYESLERVFYHPPITFSWIHFGVLAATVVVKFLLFLFFYYIDRKSSSPIIKVEKIDSILDTAVTAMTLLSFALAPYTSVPVDGIVGLIISGVIIVMGCKTIAFNFTELMGKRQDEAIDKIKTLLKDFVDKEDILDIKVFDYGSGNVFGAVTLKKGDVDSIKEKAENTLGIKLTIELRR